MGNAQTAADRPEDRSLKLRQPQEAGFFETYEIGDLLGSGSFGQVRKCWLLHDATVKHAVKAIDTKSEVFEVAGAWLSARKEASVLQSVSHPHIVKLIEVFEKERWLFLVMEHISGGQLFQALANPRTAITEGCVALVGSQLLQALQHLHLRRIIHRDVKAENILLGEDPAKTRRWHIKLIDFGLALRMEHSSSFMFRMCQQEPPLEHLVCGTAYYCAPEVWFHDYSPSVDVWAAGVVLYLAMFGQFPFHDRNPTQLEVLICEEDREPSYRPICSQDHPSYQASAVATAALKQLLTKAREDRPDACTALHLEWFKTAHDRSLDNGQLRRNGREGPVCIAGVRLLGSWDQVIPPTLRAKAGRAAMPPAIEAAQEEKRTQALEAMKMRSTASALGKAGSHRRFPRLSGRETRTPMFEPLEVSGEHGFLEQRGFGMPVLHDIVSSATFSDSEGEDFVRPRLALLCSCEPTEHR
ncbi:Dclk3 [Symbiodinium natans]|uniref:Dclk3 protein n=1 Tax=Symbiodinium natans TaxID=878477 RepID=A0A812S6E9_9DINO|nr:Dclk3 [Symbiodinium natans]